MIKFIQVTYPFLLVWVAFTQHKIANLEESLSQVKETTEKNEELLHPNISPDSDTFMKKDMTKVSENTLREDINILLDTHADKGATTSLERSIVNSKNKKYSLSKEPFNLATHKQPKNDNANTDIGKDYGNYEHKISRSVHRKQRKRKVYSADFKTKETDLIYKRNLNNNNTDNNTTTTCVLLNNLDYINFQQYELNNSITTFDFTLDLMTDDWPEETSWKLLQQNSYDTIIDSRDENTTSSDLVNNTLHEFEYHCVVSSEETNEINNIQLENICYNFELHDDYGDGICCNSGLGYFSLSLNNNTTPLIRDRLYTSSFTSSFCLGNKNISSESKSDTPSKYPARECINEPCICDSKPRLSNIEEDDVMFNTKVLTLNEIIMISDSKALADYESPQYKAGCWVLHDDAFFHENSLELEKRQQRMIQRYLLALFYFATTTEKWDYHYHFLSSKSECEWNVHDRGIFCDWDSNAFFISLWEINLEGTIVDELSELRTLEYLSLYDNNIHGAIPSVLGRLSELRVLNLYGNKLEGTVPPQLFNALNLEKLHLGVNRLEGTIPEAIMNLQGLSYLYLGKNNLSGPIPDAIYTLKNLIVLGLPDNKLSSSISSYIGSMNKLEHLWLEDNMLTGEIPSTIGRLSLLLRLLLRNNRLSGSIPSTLGNMTSLKNIWLSNNTLSGPIPESLFDLPNLEYIQLQDNSVTGLIPDEFCEVIYDGVEADCRNDVFNPEVNCTCCTYCEDESPIWDGDCAGATVKVVIDHDSGPSDGLVWSLTNDKTENEILFDGPYVWKKKGLQSYEACVAYSDCFSVNMFSPPEENTNYHIYWNNKSIYNDTFLSNGDNALSMITFQYENVNKQMEINYNLCNKAQYTCGKHNESFDFEASANQYTMYRQVIIISGIHVVNDPSSPQSRALCWLLHNHIYFDLNNNSETKFIQKYVLTLLHLSSAYPIFGSDEYPPSIDECQWQGVSCRNDSDIVTEIYLEKNQTIDGTLLPEFGSLKYFEKLNLSHSKVSGTIPRVFSNLWSLRELNLSGNKISGTMPTTMFRQLKKLEHIDLSDNSLSGSINEDIGRYSHIRSLLLSKNQLTGSVPLDSFDEFHLEYFNISENQLSELDFQLLMKHKDLKTVDISANFFVGSLEEDMFELLPELEYFNISQNAFTGMIPTTIYEATNITNFDAHANRLKGAIPNGISYLSNLQYLNLQGNELTGSLPSEINSLKKLETLVISHNKLKGSIPLQLDKLPKMQRLHLHDNNFVGKAPDSSSGHLKSYYTDCGHPSVSLDPVVCPSCNKCCNADGLCQEKSMKEISQITATIIFVFTIVGVISLLYIVKDKITSSRLLQNFFTNTVNEWNASTLLSDKSVYHFLLAQNKTEWRIGFTCGIFQADIANKSSDKQYTFTCPSNTLECEDSRYTNPYGIFIFSVILAIWLLRDIIDSTKLMLLSFQKKSIDYFFASGMIFTVTMLSLWTSIIYIIAIATKNTELIKDAVVLLFVVEVDERLFQLVQSINPAWVGSIESTLRGSLVLDTDDLVISDFFRKSNERYESVKSNVRKSYRTIVKPSRKEEKEIHGKRLSMIDESRP